MPGEAGKGSGGMRIAKGEILWISAFSLLSIVLDRITKLWIDRSLYPGQSIPVLDNVLWITYTRNKGIAFGLFSGLSHVLGVLSLLALLFFLLLYGKIPYRKLDVQAGCGMIVGGAIGNLLDRLAFGYVIDFIDFRVWPVFNVSDIAICVGIGLILLEMAREGKG
jgi:signal peptidase II